MVKNINKSNIKYYLFSIITFALIVGIGFAWLHQVDNSISDEDETYINRYVAKSSFDKSNTNYQEEINFIKNVQKSVLDIAPVNKGLPFNAKREPKDLYENRFGLCLDRSRVIEKILKHYGFQTRHIFIFSIKSSSSRIGAFFTRRVPSHAVTEVFTQRGWLVVDSNHYWTSLDVDGNPVSIQNLQKAVINSSIDWENELPKEYKETKPFSVVYGLYSRHGRFYPPYNPIPDVNYSELIQNFY